MASDQTFPLIWRKSTSEDYLFLYWGMMQTLAETIRTAKATSEKEIQAHFYQMARLSWWIVLRDGQPIAALTTRRIGSRLHLLGIFVLPEYQNQGVGTTMLQELISWAGHRQLTLVLQVFFINEKARQLYERFGFCVAGAGDTSYIMELAPPSTESPSRFPLLRRIRDRLRR
jgi:RimJ/RimL family protein N-acetyltransferase